MKIKRYNSIGREELIAASKVIKNGILSDFIGSNSKKFLGGKYVQKFENQITKYFKVKYAITTNSWTSGLIAALGSMNLQPGDEVICTPWTMSACASSILHWNAIPVFVDIDKNTFNFNLENLKKNITRKTKAILAVDIFGQSENINEIKKIIKNRKIYILSDSAQAIGAKYKGKFAGTIADIGGYSLNCHKHINTGEGGIIVTNNKKLAEKCRLIRNHAESVNKSKKKKDLTNLVGYNFRLGEIESAIGIEQLKKLNKILAYRKKLAFELISKIKDLPGLQTPHLKRNCTHIFYVIPFVLDLSKLKYNRKKIVHLLSKSGVVGLNEGYQNLHRLPLFQKKIAYGSSGFPWKPFNQRISYKRGNCKVAEDLHNKTFFYLSLCSYDFKVTHMKKFAKIFQNQWKNIKKN